MTKCLRAVDFRLDDPETQKDPYAFYPVLRDQSPVMKSDLAGQPCWILSRRTEILKVLTDPATFSSRVLPLSNMLFSDPPDHERLRNMVSRLFTSAAVAPMADRVTRNATSLLDHLLQSERCDIVGDFAAPLTVGMIAQILGIQSAEVQKIRDWTRAFNDYVLSIQLGRSPLPATQRAEDERMAFMRDLLKNRNYEDGGVVSILASLHFQGHLTVDEFSNFIVLLFVAGHATTTNWIGNAMYTLATRPGDLDRLARNESLISPYLEEVLRTRPSFHRLIRITTREVELCGEVIPAGAIIRLLIASANRDPQAFLEPEAFDPDQKRRLHSSFGQGIHTCLGIWLARLEATTCIKVIASKIGKISLDPENPAILLSGGTFNDFGFERLPLVLSVR